MVGKNFTKQVLNAEQQSCIQDERSCRRRDLMDKLCKIDKIWIVKYTKHKNVV